MPFLKFNRKKKKAHMAGEDLSFADIASALLTALGEDPDGDGDEDYPWIVDVFPNANRFVYSCDGLYYEQGYSLNDQGETTLVGSPREVESKTTYQPVDVASMASSNDGDDVVYEGEIFRSGSYPDKNTEASPASLMDIARRMTRKRPILDQHGDRSPFYKALHETDENGELKYGLENVRAMENGKWLWGKIRLPKWVADALGDEVPVSVGMALDGTGKPIDIYELSLVDEGRVKTAVISRKLAAAYAAFAGSRHSKTDMDMIQGIHDFTANLGAVCLYDDEDGDGQMDDDGAEMSGSRHSKSDMEAIQQMHDLATSQGAVCPARTQMSARHTQRPARARNAAKDETMTPPLKKLIGYLAANPQARDAAGLSEADLATFNQTSTTVDPNVATALAQFEQRTKDLQAQIDRQDGLLLQSQAEAFATDVIERQKRATPAERADLVAMFCMAAKADGNGKATFAEGGKVNEGANLKLFKESVAKRRVLPFFEQQIPNANPSSDTGQSQFASHPAAGAPGAKPVTVDALAPYNNAGSWR